MADRPEKHEVEVQAMAVIFDWQLHERRIVDANDPEWRALINYGLVQVVDEETRKTLPPPPQQTGKGGCGCGS